MGPESKNTPPSAKNFKKNLWRPLAALIVLSSSACFTEKESTTSPQNLSSQEPTNLLILDELFKGGEIAIGELRDDIVTISLPDRNSCDEIRGTDYHSQPERNWYLENCLIKSSSTSSATLSSELSPITGYFCARVSGYPIGDGGGYCGNTASGKPPSFGEAACGSKWKLGDELSIQGFRDVICTDRGHLAENQVDVFFPTNKDLYESGLPSRAIVTKIN